MRILVVDDDLAINELIKIVNGKSILNSELGINKIKTDSIFC